MELVEQKKGQQQQKLPYSLSALQIDAGKIFGYLPQEVLDTQQSLYEKSYFWGCSKYPECKTTLPDRNGKPDFGANKKHSFQGQRLLVQKLLKEAVGPNKKL